MNNNIDNLIDDLKNHKENLDPCFLKALEHYDKTFVQRWPRYGIKPPGGKNWRSKNKPLSDPVIIAHLYGKYYVGVLSRWYPDYAVFDIDSRSIEFVNEHREMLFMNESNSMLFPSESPNSYHLYFKPTFKDEPLTINLLHSILKSFSSEHNVEVYPRDNRFFRAPFSSNLYSLDLAYYNLNTWQDKLYWFDKLDDYDISRIPGQQLSLDLEYETPGKITSTLQEGKELYEHGLQYPGTRNDSQYKVLYYLWRLNIPHHQAVCMTWKWIKEKHNGFSKEIDRYPRKVKGEIDRQAAIIYGKYELTKTFPDSTNNLYHGFIAKPDIPEIFKITRGNMPRAKFLYYILKYSYPRRLRDFIGIHSDKLAQWSSKETNLKYLNEFKSMGVLSRGSAYSIGSFSKNIKLNWKYKSSDEAILYDGRSVDTLEDTLRFLYEPPEFREILRSSGASKDALYKSAKRVYDNTPD